MIALALLACTTPAPTPDPAPTPEMAPETAPTVEIAGCSTMLEGPRCLVTPDATLTVWVDTDQAPISSPGAQWQPAEGGFRATFQGDDLDHLEIVSTEGGPYHLEIAARERIDAILQATTLARGGDVEAARAILRGALDQLEGEPRARATWGLTTLGDRGWDLARVEAGAEASGQWWWAIRAALARADHALRDDRRSGGALAAIERAKRYVRGDPGFRLRYSLAHYEGWARLTAADPRGALAAYAEAEASARRVDRQSLAEQARLAQADVMARSGRTAEALTLLEAHASGLEQEPDPCRRASGWNAYGWGLLVAAEAGSPGTTDPAIPLDRALSLLDGADCAPLHDPARYSAQIHLNRALAAIRAGDPLRAVHHLEASAEASPELDEPWALEIQARIARAQGQHDRALQLSQRLEARAGDQLELAWMALRGQGLALEGLGRGVEALERHTEAQALLFRQGLLVPVHLGRGAYLDQRRSATAHLAQLYLDAGAPRRAFDAWRNHRAQYLAGLHQDYRLDGPIPGGWLEALDAFRSARAALDALPEGWSVPDDDRRRHQRQRDTLEAEARAALDRGLAALGIRVTTTRRRPAPGELLLGWYPEDDGWIGFAEDSDGIWTDRLDPGEEPTADRLIAPFAEPLQRASRITLLPHAELDPVDLHAAHLDARPLLAHAPVHYGLDLADRPLPQASPGRALVVVDPHGDLAGARAEGATVEATLRDQGWEVQSLIRDRATRAAFLEAVPGVELLHYSGHASSAPAWGSELGLADGALSVADVLALPRVPPVVILNACETGRQADPGSVGLAQAFLTAGTTVAIASGEPIPDRVAAEFSAELYAALGQGLGWSGAYQRAMSHGEFTSNASIRFFHE
ncbi:MAG TPA: CHAT domain-containing protein [Deltaproteobacteria bacterium]|nr:CHAT domain-containing protein [Deltaproteobacteria bacterium]